MWAIKYISILCCLLFQSAIFCFANVNLPSKTCKIAFYRYVYDTLACRSYYIAFDFVDSNKEKHTYLVFSAYLYYSIIEEKPMLYSEYQKLMFDLAINDSFLNFKDFGKIKKHCHEITNDKFVTKWLHKGQKKYLRHFFYDNRVLKNKYVYRVNVNLENMLYLGYKLGVAIKDHELNYLVYNINSCYDEDPNRSPQEGH